VTIKVSEQEFVSAWQRLGSPDAVSKELGLAIRNIYGRRARLAKKGIFLPTNSTSTRPNTEWTPRLEFERQRRFEIDTGSIIIFSDPHFLPDHRPAAMQALLTLCKDLKPKLVFCGGDAVDGDTISRWDPTRGHHKRFSVREELDTVKQNFDAIDAVIGKTPRAWVLGNHDVRLSRFVATKAPELVDMPGMRLEDWAPKWPLSWTIAVNAGTAGMLILRHRNQAGMLHLQAQKSGCHYAHGHLHRLNDSVMPTFNGKRYSIDCGSLADPESEGFDYMEGNMPHVQGFAVLTYHAGQLLKPEFCYEEFGSMWFRGARV
jgi:hypothetical protein